MNRMEELRVEKLRTLGCVACAYLNVVNVNALELNHLLYGNRRMGDWFTIFLCRGHHQGDWTDEQRQIFHRSQLVAISDGRKAFSKIYPTERELWELSQERLGLTWPFPKIVSRAAC